MADDPQGRPPMARPLAPLIMARPIYPIADACAPLPKGYPDVDMTRTQAFVDLLLGFWAFVLTFIGLELVFYLLLSSHPSYSPFWASVPIGLTILAFVAGVLYFRKQSHAAIGLGKPPWLETTVGTFLAVPACFGATIVIGAVYGALIGFEETLEERRLMLEMIPEPGVWSFLVIGPFTGLHEEVFFRGFVLTRMVVLFRSKIAAIFASGILFGLPHIYQGVGGVCQTAAIGIVLATLVTLTRSLWPAILAHGIFNSIQLVLMSFFRDSILDPSSVTTAPAI